jgi:hypothetical protein
MRSVSVQREQSQKLQRQIGETRDTARLERTAHLHNDRPFESNHFKSWAELEELYLI